MFIKKQFGNFALDWFKILESLVLFVDNKFFWDLIILQFYFIFFLLFFGFAHDDNDGDSWSRSQAMIVEVVDKCGSSSSRNHQNSFYAWLNYLKSFVFVVDKCGWNSATQFFSDLRKNHIFVPLMWRLILIFTKWILTIWIIWIIFFFLYFFF